MQHHPASTLQMQSQASISWFSSLHLLLIINFLILFQFGNGSSDPGSELYQKCGNTFSCGSTVTGVGYPFRRVDDPSYCGHPSLVLSCDDHSNVTNIDIMNIKYRVMEIEQGTQTMRIVREDTMRSICPTEMANTTLDYAVFDYAASCMNYTFLYGCTPAPGFHSNISCGSDRGAYVFPGAALGPGDCDASVVVSGPVMAYNGPLNATELGETLRHGFQIRWKMESRNCSDCTASKGRCGYDFATNQTVCYCPDPPYTADVCGVASYGPSPLSPQSKGMYSGLLSSFLSILNGFCRIVSSSL